MQRESLTRNCTMLLDFQKHEVPRCLLFTNFQTRLFCHSNRNQAETPCRDSQCECHKVHLGNDSIGPSRPGCSRMCSWPGALLGLGGSLTTQSSDDSRTVLTLVKIQPELTPASLSCWEGTKAPSKRLIPRSGTYHRVKYPAEKDLAQC